MVFSFVFFLVLTSLIGLSSYFFKSKTTQDYLLAGQSINPSMVGLSAAATTNSGYMFTGLIGYAYLEGVAAFSLLIPWLIGDFISSFFVHKKLREVVNNSEVLSYSGAVSQWFKGQNFKKLRILLGVIILVFLSIYAAAQFKAGAKALYVVFDWDYKFGVFIGSILVLLYCLAGGIRASIWTDVIQAIVMLVTTIWLLFYCIDFLGGVDQAFVSFNNVSPDFMNFMPQGWHFLLAVCLGYFLGGMGVVGQAHIMTRYMTMKNIEDMKRVRMYYYSWSLVFYVLMVFIGLSTRVILNEGSGFDTELALPIVTEKLLPNVLVGLILAGLFSATMSTADSQILSCTAVITRDFSQGKWESYYGTKLVTLGVCLFSLLIALYGGSNVFDLVLFAWAAMASTIGILIIVFALKVKLSENESIFLVIMGFILMFVWRSLGLNSYIYEVFPPFFFALLFILYIKKIKGLRNKKR